MAWSHARISFSFVPVNSGCTRSFGNKTIPRSSTCMLPCDLATLSQKWSPHLAHVSFWDSEARISRQNVSIHLRIPPDSLLLTDTLRYGLQALSHLARMLSCHCAFEQNLFFSAVRRRKDLKFALQVSKRLTEKAPVPGALFCKFFRLCTINTHFWDFEALPECLTEKD